MSGARGAAEQALELICTVSKRDVASKQISGGRTSSFYIAKEREMRLISLDLTRILAGVALVLAYAGVANAVDFDIYREKTVCSPSNKDFYNKQRCECLRKMVNEYQKCILKFNFVSFLTSS